MEALLETLLSIVSALTLALGGYSFKMHGSLQKALADSAGWKTSYEREKENTDRYVRAEELTKLGVLVGDKFAEAIAKLPRVDS